MIASGGEAAPRILRPPSTMAEGGHCQAALAASIFHFKETTVGEVKAELLLAGIPVRPPVGLRAEELAPPAN